MRSSDFLRNLSWKRGSIAGILEQMPEGKGNGNMAEQTILIAEDDPDIRDGVRIPLTTLLLYTEILRGHKCDTPEQEAYYLNKIDAKARQIKQLSDNLFEYALVTRDTVAVLDPPVHFSEIFEGPLTELVETLQQRGFACALDLGEEDLLLRVKGQYIRRILDNISSNILKYADPAQDIEVRFIREEGRAGLCFANGVVEDLHPEESTRVGLTSIETMMEKMNAEMRVEQGGGRFGITLLFPMA